jgi:hypothetical protein
MPTPFHYFLNGFRSRDTGSVTGFALQAGKWRALVALLPVFGFEDIEYRVFVIFVMTLDAGVGAFLGVGAGLHRRLDVGVVVRGFGFGGLQRIGEDQA